MTKPTNPPSVTTPALTGPSEKGCRGRPWKPADGRSPDTSRLAGRGTDARDGDVTVKDPSPPCCHRVRGHRPRRVSGPDSPRHTGASRGSCRASRRTEVGHGNGRRSIPGPGPASRVAPCDGRGRPSTGRRPPPVTGRAPVSPSVVVGAARRPRVSEAPCPSPDPSIGPSTSTVVPRSPRWGLARLTVSRPLVGSTPRPGRLTRVPRPHRSPDGTSRGARGRSPTVRPSPSSSTLGSSAPPSWSLGPLRPRCRDRYTRYGLGTRRVGRHPSPSSSVVHPTRPPPGSATGPDPRPSATTTPNGPGPSRGFGGTLTPTRGAVTTTRSRTRTPVPSGPRRRPYGRPTPPVSILPRRPAQEDRPVVQLGPRVWASDTRHSTSDYVS